MKAISFSRFSDQCFFPEDSNRLPSESGQCETFSVIEFMADDILDTVLDLEDEAYQDGFDEGKADGTRAGYTEGKIFGIERGYHKALEMGKLHGRALMLNACLSDPNPMPENFNPPAPVNPAMGTASDPSNVHGNIESEMSHLPALPENPRLKKHIETLLKLTDPYLVSVDNTETAVAEFDDRMKKAVAKAKIIDKLISEPYNMTVSGDTADSQSQSPAGSGNIEELSNVAVRR